MLLVNLRDGQTLRFDLEAADQAADWARRQGDSTFQRSISGLAVSHDRILHTLPVPSHFRRVAFEAGLLRNGTAAPVGIRVGVQADDVHITLTVYLKGNPRSTRLDIQRVGRPRWVPEGRPWPVEMEKER